uniref:Uncharacterized protein n=1 Tax=Caenorhabditis japonica TaxID=281687 RepID=A0A8R1EEN5_CAEJA
MVGAAVINFQIGPFKIEHLTHFTEGRCTPTGPEDYTFIIGNDILSQLPKFVFDYAKARFLIGGAILPMGNVQPTTIDRHQRCFFRDRSQRPLQSARRRPSATRTEEHPSTHHPGSGQFHQKLSNPRKSTTQSHAIDAEYGENQ